MQGTLDLDLIVNAGPCLSWEDVMGTFYDVFFRSIRAAYDE